VAWPEGECTERDLKTEPEQNRPIEAGAMSMFSPSDRTMIRERVLALGRADGRVTGGAITGSTAVDAEDRWSDVDTAFGYAPDVRPEHVLADWTEALERDLDLVHHFDLSRGATRYRVFLLSNGLELDVSLTPAEEFGAHGPAFRLVFGESVGEVSAAQESSDELIGWGWIYLFSARAAIERNRAWQAACFIGAARDHGLALACVRSGLPSVHARGVYMLSEESTAPWAESLVTSLDRAELSRALGVAVRAFLTEVAQSDPSLAERLSVPLSPLQQ
jgi:hypothetical protein